MSKQVFTRGLYTHRNLADKYGVSTRTISRILGTAGLEGGGNVPRTPSDVVGRVRGGVLADLEGGMTVYEVAESHDIPVDTVVRISGGEPTRKKDVGLDVSDGKDDVVSDKIVALHEGGRKMTEIAGELGVSVYIVRKVLVERGIGTRMVKVENPPKGTKADRMRGDILVLHSDGKAASEIADVLGVSVSTVRKVLGGAGMRGTKSSRMAGEMLRLHGEGLSVADIAARCGVSAPTVRKVLASVAPAEPSREKGEA